MGGEAPVDPSSLRRRIVRELNRQGYRLRSLSFSRNGEGEKDFIRARHRPQRKRRLAEESAFLARRGAHLLREFAEGSEIVPSLISPALIPVAANTEEADLFRLASLVWSVPTSRGYGRRLRYLVRDQQNGKLIGLIALGDPVFNLRARDDWIGWSARDRDKRLVNVMDAYVLGAVPPYNQVMCGKLVALLATSIEVTRDFRRKYGRAKGVISGEEKNPQLALLTTTSALGRSSVYNRLSLPGGVRFQRVGNTKGYGHFHVPVPVFEEVKRYMQQVGHPYARGHHFGDGPNWRLRLLRAAFSKLGIDGEVLKHGILREVYVAALAENTVSFLIGRSKRLRRISWPATQIAAYCLERWIVPRADRDSRFRESTRKTIAAQIADGSRRVERLLAGDSS